MALLALLANVAFALQATDLYSGGTRFNDRVSGWIHVANTDCGAGLVCLGARTSLVNSAMAALIDSGCFPDGTGCSEVGFDLLSSLKAARDSVEDRRLEDGVILNVEQLQAASLPDGEMRSVVERWIVAAEAEPCTLVTQLCDTGRLWLLGEADQAARSLPQCANASTGCWSDRANVRSEIDARIAPIRVSFFERVAWPDATEWGESAANAAWLLVQHADKDLTFQREVLARLNSRPALSKVDQRHRAFLVDRVAVAAGEPQVYGTQGRCTESGWRMFPVLDAVHIDDRRAQLGMQSMAQYAVEVAKNCS